MRSIFYFVMLALAAALASCSSSESKATSGSTGSDKKPQARDTFKRADEFDAADVAGIHALRDQWTAAFARGDAKPVEFMFTNDAVFSLPDDPALSKGDALSAKEIFDRYESKLVFDESSEQYVTDGGDPRKMTKLPWVSYYSAYTLTLEPKAGGNALQTKGRFMTRFHRQSDGSLAVIHGPDIGNPAPDFTLEFLKHDGTLRLSSLRGKPTVVIFGSYT